MKRLLGVFTALWRGQKSETGQNFINEDVFRLSMDSRMILSDDGRQTDGKTVAHFKVRRRDTSIMIGLEYVGHLIDKRGQRGNSHGPSFARRVLNKRHTHFPGLTRTHRQVKDYNALIVIGCKPRKFCGFPHIMTGGNIIGKRDK